MYMWIDVRVVVAMVTVSPDLMQQFPVFKTLISLLNSIEGYDNLLCFISWHHISIL